VRRQQAFGRGGRARCAARPMSLAVRRSAAARSACRRGVLPHPCSLPTVVPAVCDLQFVSRGQQTQTADGRNHSAQTAGIWKRRARPLRGAPDVLGSQEIGGGAQRLPPRCSSASLPTAHCGSCCLRSAVRTARAADADGRRQEPQCADSRHLEEAGAPAARRARCPWQSGDRRRRAAPAAAVFFRIPAHCPLWFLPSAVCWSHPAGSRQQAAGSKQQAAGSKQQAAGGRQQAAACLPQTTPPPIPPPTPAPPRG
jgi:hypothetical protein